MEVESNSYIFDIAEKVILVTGGAVGIGAGLVRELLSQNARHVAFLDVLEREGAALEGELSNKFGALRAKFIKCDISDENQLLAAFEQVLDKYRRLDAVVNNAAVVSEEVGYRRMVDVNFIATVNSTLKALEVMAVNKGASGGVVLNVSSLLALKPQTTLPVFAATKAAVLHFSNDIATQKSLLNAKVRIVTVCLGPTDTAMLHRHNFEKHDSHSTTFKEEETGQRVISAVSGITSVLIKAENGSTWVIADDVPPIDVTAKVREGFSIISKLTDD